MQACHSGRAQTKDKGERPIRYLRESIHYGRTLVSDADLNAQVMTWLDTVANVSVHSTTDCVPADRFATVVRPTLQPLPTSPHRSGLVALPARSAAPRTASPVPSVVVERRSLQDYAALGRVGVS
ncbi:MAG: hypothetical protein ABS52_07730 [Gemmatimonadetes bacterium SCN 70-22]|nr:MAG: hypothetical protein ABS52_07730 [Gemmatimonadetes bacterium SCN 70-22]